VKNLDNPEYMNIILAGKASLVECFAEIEHDSIQLIIYLQIINKSEHKLACET